jgi:hypothetical protein
MGPGWGRTVRHRSAPTDTVRPASCPLTCMDSLGQHRLAPSDMPGVGLLIRGLGVQVPRGAPHLTWAFAWVSGVLGPTWGRNGAGAGCGMSSRHAARR